MGFFNSKRKEMNNYGESSDLPELPNLPTLPNLAEESESSYERSEERNTLPSFPNSEFGEKMNQNRVKEAVAKNQEISFDMKPMEMQRTNSAISNPPQMNRVIMGEEKRRTLEVSDWTKSPQISPVMEFQKTSFSKREPLFIKLDTFEKSIASFNEIKLRVSEIESLLKSIKDIKEKEDRELMEWEKEMETIKMRLGQIDKDLFNNL